MALPVICVDIPRSEARMSRTIRYGIGEILPLSDITIFLIRGEKVIIDADLAEFYGVQTKRLNEQVKRNKERFPVDFMFQLSIDEIG